MPASDSDRQDQARGGKGDEQLSCEAPVMQPTLRLKSYINAHAHKGKRYFMRVRIFLRTTRDVVSRNQQEAGMRLILMGAALAMIAGAVSAQSTGRVRGYIKRDGTYVAPHVRTNPNNTRLDNYSTAPNYNPYTGKQGTEQPFPAPTYKPYTPYTPPKPKKCAPNAFYC